MLTPAILEEVLENHIFNACASSIHQSPAEHGFFPDSPRSFFSKRRPTFCNEFLTVIKQKFMELNIYWANLRAVATQAGGIAEVHIIFKAVVKRCNYRTDRAGISLVVRMSPYIF